MTLADKDQLDIRYEEAVCAAVCRVGWDSIAATCRPWPEKFPSRSSSIPSGSISRWVADQTSCEMGLFVQVLIDAVPKLSVIVATEVDLFLSFLSSGRGPRGRAIR